MTSKAHLFLLVVVCASCALVETEGFVTRQKRQLETIAEVGDAILDNAAGAISDIAEVPTNTVYQILRLITAPLRGIFGAVTAPLRLIYHTFDGVLGPIFSVVKGFLYPFRALAGNVILSIGNAVHAIIPPLGVILQIITQPVGDAVYPGRRRRDLSLRIKRSTADTLASMSSGLMSLPSGAVDSASTMSADMLTEFAAAALDVTCKVGEPYYESWTGHSIDCDEMKKDFRSNPGETLTALGNGIFDDTTETMETYFKGISAGALEFAKSKLLPVIFDEIDEMKGDGSLPGQISYVIEILETMYNTVNMLGII